VIGRDLIVRIEMSFVRAADPGVVGPLDPVVAIQIDGPADDIAGVLGECTRREDGEEGRSEAHNQIDGVPREPVTIRRGPPMRDRD